jgi:hypothetical protein
MIAYKLMRIRKDGSLGPLFINKKQKIPIGVWLEAESHETKGFAYRPGWHATVNIDAPHLKMLPSRIWAKVEVAEVQVMQRPSNQGTWVLAKYMRVLEVLHGVSHE